MGQPHHSKHFGTWIFIASTLALFIFIGNYQSNVAFWIPPTMVIAGVSLFLITSISYGRYRNIFDYEPTTLLGRPTNGKRVRNLLKTLALIGGWLLILGGYLWIFI